jgi:glycosyltransferase involved in cell wall biosynthesis
VRIGIYAPNLRTPAPSGVERYVEELVRALAALPTSHEFVLFSDAADLVASPRWRLHPLPSMGWLRRLRYDHRLLVRAAAEERIDVLHCTKSYVPEGLACPAVVTVHDVIFLKHPEFYPWWWRGYWKRAVERTVIRARAVVCVSGTTARDLESLLPGAHGKTVAILSGVSPASSAALPSSEEPYFLCVGTITARKNVGGLLDAIDRLEPGAPLLVVAGSVDPHAGDARRLEAASAAGRVKFLGRVSEAELASLYARARALVHPSLYEGFGFSVLEAMAAGCPVVACRAGAVPEVAGDAAILVEPGDAAALAEALRRVAADEGLRRDLSARGRARAAEFTWRRTAERTLEVYERIGRHEAAARA